MATQFPTRDDILEVAGRYSAMPLQYGGLYRPDSQTSLLLLQQQQLQQAQKQILQYKQQERILQQQVKDLQLQVRALQQQQKTYWKGTTENIEDAECCTPQRLVLNGAESLIISNFPLQIPLK